MSLTHLGTINLTSSTVRDGCTDEANDQVIICETTGPSVRKFSLTTQTQVGTNITCLSTPTTICMIDGSSAIVASSAVTTVDFIELATQYRVNFSGGQTTPSLTKGQMSAADTSAKIAFIAASNSRSITKVNGNTFTVSTITLAIGANSTVTTVIYKSSDRWLIGTSIGRVYEIDSSGNIKDELNITYDSPFLGVLTGSYNTPSIRYMSIDNNLLLVSINDGSLILYDWSTKTKLNQMHVGKDNGIVLCSSSSGITLASRNYILGSPNSNQVYELDFTVQPIHLEGALFTDSNQAIYASGINSITGRCWAIQTSVERIRVFSINSRVTTTKTITAQVDGTDVKSRILIIDNNSGSNAKLLLDTYMQSPGIYRVPTGKTIYEVVKYGEGANAQAHVSKYNT